MKTRPILFSAPMVRAILDGSKTQTRRVIKRQDVDPLDAGSNSLGHILALSGEGIKCPYGQASNFGLTADDQRGDQLWVRETWKYFDWTEDGEPCIAYAADNATAWPSMPEDEDQLIKIEDAWANLSEPKNYLINNRASDKKWRPSINMPRWASRIKLEITGVRVERLNDISREDAWLEGCDQQLASHLGLGGIDAGQEHFIYGGYARKTFIALWESINGDGSWDTNPWVWVVEFKRVKP